MIKLMKPSLIFLVLAVLSGCSVNPQTGEREFSRTGIGATIGGVAGGLLGGVVGGKNGAVIGVAAGAAVGAGTGYWMEQRAAKLQADLADQGIASTTSIDPATGAQVMTIQAPADVSFAASSAELQSGAFFGLSAIAEAVKGQSNLTLEVVGHTDSTGNERFNDLLSYARAQSVAQYLYANGVNAKAISVRGVGDRMPAADNKTSAGRALNRRVEIQIKEA